ncbi:MAG: replicative DNA helicase [Actinobacteria bacterium]|nr:replicative DNA helicase [Actinomycetota bacterium]
MAELPNNRAPRDTNISSIGADFERTPPQDLIAEQSVLGGMLLSKDAIADVIEIIRDRDFYRPAHELIYDAVIDLYGRGEPVDAVTVASELTKRGDIARAGGAPYLHTLISSVPTAANAGYYAKIVREHAIMRRLVEAGTKIVQLGYTSEGEVDDMVDQAQAEVYAVTERRASEDYVHKSEITMRMLSAEARVGLNNIRAGTLSDDEWSRLARRMGEISEAPLFIDDSPNLSMMEIRAKARRLKQRHDLKLIVIDYLQLMSSGKKVENRQQEVSEFSRQLKLMAKELNIPVIAISQLNRSPEQRSDKKPMLSDLRESGSIEQDADVVILLHRDDMYDQQNRTGEADLIVAKHRNGPTRTITVSAQLHYARFYDMPQNPGGGQDWTQQREASTPEDSSFGA